MSDDVTPRAAIYLRVSTREQAERAGDPEGYSIPAQREACKRKAASLGAAVVEEFADRGESARSSRRPELQRMLAYVRENTVDYVIVHKVDRLARNRVDDVEITLALQAAGATLVSCSESIDETPSGMLLHGIMSAIEAYASGDWTQRALLEELTRRGLDNPATQTRPAKPLSLSYIQHMLTNPYYKGVVRYRGAMYQGKHEPLVSEETWQAVQDVLAEKNEAQMKLRKHPHYLKGLLCGHCGSRMIVMHARSHTGRIYEYFACIGRHQKRTNCTLKAVLIERVEELVEEHYATVQIPAELLDGVEQNLRKDLAAHYERARSEHSRLERQRTHLLDEQEKLLQAHYADAVPLDLLKREQDRIRKQLISIDERITGVDDHQALIEANLERAFDLARDCQRAYLTAPPKIRRLLNHVFFERLYIEDDDSVRSDLAPPFNVLLAKNAETRAEAADTNWSAWEASFNSSDPEAMAFEVAGLKEHTLVGAPGLEPGTNRL